MYSFNGLIYMTPQLARGCTTPLIHSSSDHTSQWRGGCRSDRVARQQSSYKQRRYPAHAVPPSTPRVSDRDPPYITRASVKCIAQGIRHVPQLR